MKILNDKKEERIIGKLGYGGGENVMKKLNNDRGITLVALAITIIVLLILTSITVKKGYESYYESKDNKFLTEVQMVQHAALEQYVKFKTTKDESLLIGTKVTDLTEITSVTGGLGITLLASDGYYKLEPEQLKQIGITNTTDTYIINYEIGEAFNFTQQKTPHSGEVLYVNTGNIK